MNHPISPSKPLPPLTLLDIRRFCSKVDIRTPDECWPWLGTINDKGYGVLKVGGRNVIATRVAYFLSTGVDPHPLHACHSCDNPPCCNSAHLFTGTSADNQRDCVRKGRKPRRFGELQNGTILTAESVMDIRQRYADTQVKQGDLAAEFGVSRVTISAIITRTNWPHLPNADGTTSRLPRRRHT